MIRLTIRVIPRASRPGIAGTRDGALLVRLQSPPVEGAANEELIGLLARTFGTVRRNVAIESGERSKLKRVAIDGVGGHQLQSVLESLGIDSGNVNISS
jgi:uncharacterized protein (TIGR00251 family)